MCGKNIASFRTELKISQRELADRMQLVGIDLDKNAIQRIECGKRFVTDIEIIAFAKIFNVTTDYLLGLTPTNAINVDDLPIEFISHIVQIIDDYKSK